MIHSASIILIYFSFNLQLSFQLATEKQNIIANKVILPLKQ